jgi:hypothetical protein
VSGPEIPPLHVSYFIHELSLSVSLTSPSCRAFAVVRSSCRQRSHKSNHATSDKLLAKVWAGQKAPPTPSAAVRWVIVLDPLQMHFVRGRVNDKLTITDLRCRRLHNALYSCFVFRVLYFCIRYGFLCEGIDAFLKFEKSRFKR